MVVTVMATFVDAPAGRDEKRYDVGDVVNISKGDYERIVAQQPSLLKEGKHDLGTGICYPCLKGAQRSRKR